MSTELIQNQSVPSNPQEDYVIIFVDSADKHIKTIDENGLVIDLCSGKI
jgi:hypothetical protein